MQKETQESSLCRSLLQLAQTAYTVLEREIPEMGGLPPFGVAVLRLLRWNGPETASAIAAFLSLPKDFVEHILDEMRSAGHIRYSSCSSSDTEPVIELDTQGEHVARQIVIAQQNCVESAADPLSEEERLTVAAVLDRLALNLVSDSTGVALTCASCWALGTRECDHSNMRHSCSFRAARFATPTPDLDEDAPRLKTSRGNTSPPIIQVTIEE